MASASAFESRAAKGSIVGVRGESAALPGPRPRRERAGRFAAEADGGSAGVRGSRSLCGGAAGECGGGAEEWEPVREGGSEAVAEAGAGALAAGEAARGVGGADRGIGITEEPAEGARGREEEG